MDLKETFKKYRAVFLPALATAALLSVFFFREMYYISYSSATYDEHYYISYGYSLLKTGDWRLANDKPDLVPLLTALPLLATGAAFDTGNAHWKQLGTVKTNDECWLCGLDFLHNNTVPAAKLLFYARLPIVFLAMLLGLAVSAWAARLYGRNAGLLSLFLYTTCPNILAHAGLATEDLALTAFAFFTVYAYSRYNRTKKTADLLLAGAALGLALNTKHTALLLLPALACYCAADYFLRGRPPGSFQRGCAALGAVVITAFLVLLPFYKLFSINHYFSGLVLTSAHVAGGHMSFMNGRLSPDGFWDFFIYAILVKTPLPVLLCAALAAAARFRERLVSEDDVYLLLFPALLFLAASFSGYHIGLRLILPVYPFLFVFCGGALKFFKGKLSVAVPAALLLWQARASAGVHPYYLTYFNELAGGPAHGDQHLLDSNLDWGQDLNGLKRYLDEENVSDLILSYFGSALPADLGRDFQDMFSTIAEKKPHVNGLKPSREYLAVSATNLHGVYFGEFGADIFYWLRGRTPRAVIGNNIRVYDVTFDARAHEHMANVYFLTGYRELAERECLRALLLDPRSRMAEFLLALVRLKEQGTERGGLALLKTCLRENGYAAPAALPEFIPVPLFRRRYAMISDYAALKFREAGQRREAGAMAALALKIKQLPK